MGPNYIISDCYSPGLEPELGVAPADDNPFAFNFASM